MSLGSTKGLDNTNFPLYILNSGLVWPHEFSRKLGSRQLVQSERTSIEPDSLCGFRRRSCSTLVKCQRDIQRGRFLMSQMRCVANDKLYHRCQRSKSCQLT